MSTSTRPDLADRQGIMVRDREQESIPRSPFLLTKKDLVFGSDFPKSWPTSILVLADPAASPNHDEPW